MNRNLSQETKHNGHTSHEQKGRQSHWKGGNFSSELKPIQLTDFQTVWRIISPDERLPPPKPQMVVFYRFQTVTHVWVVTSNAIIYSTHQPPHNLAPDSPFCAQHYDSYDCRENEHIFWYNYQIFLREDPNNFQEIQPDQKIIVTIKR